MSTFTENNSRRGLGFLKFLPGRMELVGDQVPVDIVSNAILACACVNGNMDQYNIYHVGMLMK